jgi:hypothetical protein
MHARRLPRIREDQNVKSNPNRLGKRGENMFATLIMEPFDQAEPWFDPVYLGDKFPVLDYYVELVNAGSRYYFFVQVKGTRQGYETANSETRLKVQLRERNVAELAAFPAPTYVVAIDQVKWRAFILSVNRMGPGLRTFPTRFPLNKKNLQRLWHEVKIFWEKRDMVLSNSYFVE